MSDSLRDRITVAVARELLIQARACGEYQTRDSCKVADAVIETLEADYVLVPKGHTHARIHAAREAAKASDFQDDDDDTECDTTWVAPGEIAKMMGTADE